METLAGTKSESWLSWFLRGVLILTFVILLARVFELQIIKGAYFRALADGNRIRRVALMAPRGRILARGGEILAGNREVKKRLAFAPESGFIKTDDIRGAASDEIVTEWERDYPLGEKFAPVSGYLGQISADEVKKIDPRCPEKGPKTSDQLIGRAGLEAEYDCLLSGINGEELVEVDTMGKKVRILGIREPAPGSDLKTNIDYGLQAKTAEVMRGEKGAAVITDPTGAVLALYSYPSYDPNIFLNQKDGSAVGALLADSDLPFFNRAVGGLYHPGSVFKPLIAMAALEEGKIDNNYTFEDTGVVTVNNYSYANWYFTQYGRVEGPINLVRAITRSTDTFFYKVGEKVGIDKLVEWAKKLGLDKLTGIDLPGEVPGLVPSPEWKEKVKGEPWYLGNTYHFSIGQGDLALTPLDINGLTRVIASGGKLCGPKIASGGTSQNCRDIGVASGNLNLIKEGMTGACSQGGTGYTFFDFTPQVACKTGTAETNEDGKTHAWFSVFGPKDAPEIVATIVVERGGEGSKVAGPIAREIFNYWFGKEEAKSKLSPSR